WLAGLGSRALRRRGWLPAGVTFVAFLLPVLPLRNHAYHYYLYAPLAGAAWCLAAVADALLSSGSRGGSKPRGARTRLPAGADARASRRASSAWMLACAGAALLTLNGALVVRKIET